MRKRKNEHRFLEKRKYPWHKGVLERVISDIFNNLKSKDRFCEFKVIYGYPFDEGSLFLLRGWNWWLDGEGGSRGSKTFVGRRGPKRKRTEVRFALWVPRWDELSLFGFARIEIEGLDSSFLHSRVELICDALSFYFKSFNRYFCAVVPIGFNFAAMRRASHFVLGVMKDGDRVVTNMVDGRYLVIPRFASVLLRLHLSNQLAGFSDYFVDCQTGRGKDGRYLAGYDLGLLVGFGEFFSFILPAYAGMVGAIGRLLEGVGLRVFKDVDGSERILAEVFKESAEGILNLKQDEVEDLCVRARLQESDMIF